MPNAQEAVAPAHRSKGLDRAADYVAHEPMRTLSAPSRFGPLGRFARRVLYRLLRPHTVPQRLFEVAVVDALSSLQRQIERLNEVTESLEQAQAERNRASSSPTEQANRSRAT